MTEAALLFVHLGLLLLRLEGLELRRMVETVEVTTAEGREMIAMRGCCHRIHYLCNSSPSAQTQHNLDGT